MAASMSGYGGDVVQMPQLRSSQDGRSLQRSISGSGCRKNPSEGRRSLGFPHSGPGQSENGLTLEGIRIVGDVCASLHSRIQQDGSLRWSYLRTRAFWCGEVVVWLGQQKVRSVRSQRRLGVAATVL